MESNRRLSEDVMRETYQFARSVISDKPLLSLISVHPNGEGISCSNEFHSRYTKDDAEWASDSYREYLSDLQSAIRRNLIFL